MTVLLCALLPAGLPHTKTVGSAFSPATTVVALRGRAEQVHGAVKRIVKGDPQPATGFTLPLAQDVFVTSDSPVITPPPLGQHVVPVHPYGPAPLLPNALSGQPYPRGPPIA